MEDLMEGRRMLVSGIMKAEAKSVAEKVPEKGIFSPISWAMAYYGTEHEGRLYVQHHNEHGCMIRASMIGKGTDWEISNVVFYGSKDACLAWLNEEVHVDELIEIYDHLADRVDFRE